MLDDPLFIALLGRAGGDVTITAHELAVAEQVTVKGSRNPVTGDVSLRMEG